MYKNEMFSVPPNIYIIGTMNTADRSLALIDFALRRRFAFFDMEPAFSSDGFQAFISGMRSKKLDDVINIVQELNTDIIKDRSLGAGFRIGHSYFCPSGDAGDGWLESVVDRELAPLLKEYWFDEPDKADIWIQRLRPKYSS
jgi:hypothetical protein